MTMPDASRQFDQGLTCLSEYISKAGLPISRGIEKEGLRTTPEGQLSQTDHPHALGHPLTHSRITTDYSEALLELITGVHRSRDELLNELESIHAYVQDNLADELLWAGSMPCALDGEESIRIGEYGASNIGQLKHVYRQGLGVRYGRIMQSIAGLHFNFSLDDEFWREWQATLESDHDLQTFKSEQYFALIRNFRRHAWVLMYLFGASPVLDKSFVEDRQVPGLEVQEDQDSLGMPYACSLRMGDLGYQNNAQSELNICFNTLSNFTHTLGQAVRTPYAPYQEIGIKRGEQYIQLNANILQIENEYYSAIRPKRTTHSGEKPTQALEERGVEYVEVRCMDLNPMLPLGIGASEVDFLDLLLMHALLTPSAVIEDDACRELEQNFKLTVDQGRNPNLSLSQNGRNVSLHDWGRSLIEQMRPLAEVMDSVHGDGRYMQTLSIQAEKFNDVDKTPSAQIIAKMAENGHSWLRLASELSMQHQKTLSNKLSQAQTDIFSSESQASFDEEAARRESDSVDFATYLEQYLA